MHDILALLFGGVENRRRSGTEMHGAGAGLGVAQPDCAGREIDIGPAQRQRFAKPHPGGSEKTDKQDEARELGAIALRRSKRLANPSEFVISKEPLALLFRKPLDAGAWIVLTQ